MRGVAIACGLLVLVASAPDVQAEADPKFQPMEQFVVKPLFPDGSRAPRHEPLVPIELDRRAGDARFVQSRCAGLITEVEVRGRQEAFNPLTGANPERAKPLEWAFGVDLDSSFPLIGSPDAYEYTRDYLQAFGMLTTRQTFIEGNVYLRDKAHCLPMLTYYE